MIKRKELKLIVNLYRKYYSEIFNIDDYRFNMTDNRAKMIENFILKIKSHTKSNQIGEFYLKKYFEFQFNHWYKYESKSDISRVQVEWIIGNKAFERWKKSDPEISGFIVRKNLKKDLNLKKDYKENWDNIILDINEVEEFDKSIFYNTLKGFHFCLSNTTLFNHRSKYCIGCKKSKECKNRLKTIYPKIYKKRGYEEI